MSGIIYPTCSLIFLRVGLKPTRYLPFRRRGARRDVGSRGRSIDERRSHGARTTDRDQEHVGFKIIITVLIDATWQHLVASIAWSEGAPEINQTCAFFQEL